MSIPELIRLITVITAVLLLPGWAFLSVTRFWQKWDTLQRWCVAIGLSISAYPVLFYASRSLLPAVHLGFNKNLVLLFAFIVIAIWGLRNNLVEQIKFDALEWLTIGVWGATLFTRLMFAWQHPYPAWSDSLHHTLLTQLTASNGQLPYTLELYEPTWLKMYHLGLYALTGVIQQLGGVPAHTSLLWTSQALNGLCGVGVFFALDKKVGRKGASLGSIVVGLLSFQPAWYANWGRFTQIASQTILLIAWVVTWEVLRACWIREGWTKGQLFGGLLATATLIAATFLLHFRVAGFFLPLLTITCLTELIHAIRSGSFVRTLVGIIIMGVVAILLTSPALAQAMPQFFQSRMTRINTPGVQEVVGNAFFSFPIDSIFLIGLQHWLFISACVSLAIGLLFRNQITWMVTFWVLCLWAEGEAYKLNVPWLTFTNMGAILIMLYLPAALVIGIAVEELLRKISILKGKKVQAGLLVAILFISFTAGYKRITGYEEYRQFLTPGDLVAMEWIRVNTPKSAIFAINTYIWLSNVPHGTDGGYWIPYFTGRRTTAGTMLASLGPDTYAREIRAMSDAAEKLVTSSVDGIAELCRLGVDYIYIGPKGDFTGAGLDASKLSLIPGLRMSYAKNGVYIFTNINCPNSTAD